MQATQAMLIFSLCLALFSGGCWASSTTVSVGETIPVGGTTTVATATTNTTTTTTTTTQSSGSTGPTPQVQITPAGGSAPSSTEGSGWENLGVMGGGSGEETSGTEGTGSTGSGAEAMGGSTAGTGAASAPQNQQGSPTGTGCAPALALAAILLPLFVSRK